VTSKGRELKGLLMVSKKMCGAIFAVSLLAACSSEPRSMVYFEQNLDEARAVVADKENCLGLDRTRVLSGSDECTNAHLAVNRADVLSKQRRLSEEINQSIKNKSWLPKAGN
jgi:hypothetical protein